MPVRAYIRSLLAFTPLLGALGVSLLGCSSQSTAHICGENMSCSQVFRYPLVVGGSGVIATLDPNLASDPASRTVVSLLYDGLVTLDQHLNVELWDAKRIGISGDGLTYTFHLHSGEQFADGTPVTAADYAFSINRALNPCLASPNAPALFAIKDAATFAGETCVNGQIGVNTNAGQTGPLITTLLGDALQTPDPSSLVVKLAQPAGYFLAALASPVADALDPKVIGSAALSEQWTSTLDHGATGQGTGGIFMLARWDQPGGFMALKVNPHWWGLSSGKKPYMNEIDFTLFKTTDDAYTTYLLGQFDMSYVPVQLVAQAKSNADYHSAGTLTYNGLSVNWTKPPFTSLDARQAFCLAVNRDALNTAAFSATLIPRWNIVPQGMPGFNPNVTGPDGVTSTKGDDAAAARHWAAYLSASGASPDTPIGYLYDTSDPAGKIAAQTLQAQWEQALGVQIILRGESHAAWLGDVNAGNYVITPVSATVDYPDPQDILSSLFLPVGDSQGPDVPDADTLMIAADASGSATTRLQEYQQAEQLLVTNMVTCPLFQGQEFYQLRQCVHNWNIGPNGVTPLDTWTATYVDTSCPNV